MKTVGLIIFAIAWTFFWAAWLGQLNISFNPEFHISLPKWKMALAVVLASISISLFYLQVYQDGYVYGYEKGMSYVINRLEEKMK